MILNTQAKYQWIRWVICSGPCLNSATQAHSHFRSTTQQGTHMVLYTACGKPVVFQWQITCRLQYVFKNPFSALSPGQFLENCGQLSDENDCFHYDFSNAAYIQGQTKFTDIFGLLLDVNNRFYWTVQTAEEGKASSEDSSYKMLLTVSIY
jgi:hypothetical protein